ncbi:BaiN/RdsA family NAD(P)/FAD-dependent oxidoreductase [Limobrevibacterium gyesilva]|uniref:NAD(P)/FAD-dependent oxidoreductase n=1 Tax=Limobrevibacterium gyesilva TaxID=2991712 RepID=UPI002225E4E3|nr:TIGR03862 family flavoprotein [Limobrevibacterium gyesilva]
MNRPREPVAVIGGGPAGLMAAEVIARAGAQAGDGVAVTVLERMPSVGRKLLMAGRGGLNLTHGENLEAFLDRYGPARPRLEAAITAFPPDSLIAWCEGLGQETFVGSSGRVFPKAFKASPLLRAWIARLAAMGVRIETRHRWLGWDAGGALRFAAPEGERRLTPAATVLALGGASWPRLGSDGAWTAALASVGVTPLRPANCGFTVAWSDIFRARFEGQPLKRVAFRFAGRVVRGEAVITADGIEGGAIYALSAALRDAIAVAGPATVHVDLRPDLTEATLRQRLDAPRRSQSLSTFLRKAAGLPSLAVGLVQEALHAGAGAQDLAGLVKAVPLRLQAPRPLARAISTAGGIAFDALDGRFMLRDRPGVFAAGEMLDWEAPTGGYLLQASFSTAVAAGHGVLAWLAERGG